MLSNDSSTFVLESMLYLSSDKAGPSEELYDELPLHGQGSSQPTVTPGLQSGPETFTRAGSGHGTTAGLGSRPGAGHGLVDMVFYVLYLPLFFTGPILTYDLFRHQV